MTVSVVPVYIVASYSKVNSIREFGSANRHDLYVVVLYEILQFVPFENQSIGVPMG